MTAAMPERSLSTNAYSRVLVIDTNVALESNPWSQLDWTQFGDEPILLLACAQVTREVDGKKQDSRLGERARAFNRLLRGYIETSRPQHVVSEGRVVDLAIVSNSRIDWSAYDELDQSAPDDRIVAQALHALVDDRARIELVSHDARPLYMAKAYGLRHVAAPESWRLPIKPSPDKSRIKALEGELRDCRATQPQLKISLAIPHDRPLARVHVAPPTPEQVDMLVRRKLRPVTVPIRPADHMLETIEDRAMRGADAEWRVKVRDSLPLAHRGLERLFGQHVVDVTVRNAGAVPAKSVRLAFRSASATLYPFPYLVDVLGAPDPNGDEPARLRWLDGPHLLPTDYEFSAEDDEPGPALTWSCHDFRPGSQESFRLFVDLSRHGSAMLNIEAEATCSNMNGVVSERLIEPVEDRHHDFGDIIYAKRGDWLIVPQIMETPYFGRAVWERIYENDGSRAEY